MIRKALTIATFVILLSNFASASEIIITPNSFDIDLVGGDSINKTIVIKAVGFTSPINVSLNHSITEKNGIFNGSEMWLNFSENSITLDPNQEKIVSFTLSTRPDIYPDDYFFTIELSADVEIDERGYKSGGSSGYITYCENGKCERGENYCSCPEDCKPRLECGICEEVECDGGNEICMPIIHCCGNDECEDMETYSNCPEDCEPVAGLEENITEGETWENITERELGSTGLITGSPMSIISAIFALIIIVLAYLVWKRKWIFSENA